MDPSDVPAPFLYNAVDFTTQVIEEDVWACEVNQRGLTSDRFKAGTLMPQEFEIAHFHDWIRARMPTSVTGG